MGIFHTKKRCVYTKEDIVRHCFLDLQYPDVSIHIIGKVYEINYRFFNYKLKPRYDYSLKVPYINKPFYNGQHSTNRILEWAAQRMREHLEDKIEELESNIK